MKKAICFIIGHKWNEDILTYHQRAVCDRCNLDEPCQKKEPFTIASKLWWARFKLKCWWRALKWRALLQWDKITLRWRDKDVPF